MRFRFIELSVIGTRLSVVHRLLPFLPLSGGTHVAHCPMTSAPPKVFISYSHDTVEHQKRVLGLADRLRLTASTPN